MGNRVLGGDLSLEGSQTLGKWPFFLLCSGINECGPFTVSWGKLTDCWSMAGGFYYMFILGYETISGATMFRNESGNTCRGRNDSVSSTSPSMRFGGQPNAESFLQHPGGGAWLQVQHSDLSWDKCNYCSCLTCTERQGGIMSQGPKSWLCYLIAVSLMLASILIQKSFLTFEMW